MSNTKNTIPATIAPNMRPLAILQVFAEAGRALSATEINEHIGLPKQTIHRLIKAMVQENYLKYDEGSRKLRPSRLSRNIFLGLMHASDWPIIRSQILADLSNKVHETINFVIPREKGMHYVDRVETKWAFRIQLPIGTNVPFHCTASGKIYLSTLTAARRRCLVDNLHLEALTPNTIQSKEALLQELKHIRQQGFALDREEFLNDMVAIAIPVYNKNGRYIASLSMHGPKQRLLLQDKDIAHYNAILKTYGQQLTKAL